MLHIEYPELISFVAVPSCFLSLAAIRVNMLVGQQYGQFKIQILKRLKYRVTKLILVTMYSHPFSICKNKQSSKFCYESKATVLTKVPSFIHMQEGKRVTQ